MEDLVKESKNGNINAFTELILRYKEEIYRIAKIRLSNDYDIDEAVQETMIAAFNSIKKLKKDEFFRTWLIKILINKCNKIYSKKKREITIAEKYSSNNLEKIEIISGVESDLNFYSLISILNYEERIAMVLYYVYGYKIKEISKILDTNENTIKARLARGKEKIKNRGGLGNG